MSDTIYCRRSSIIYDYAVYNFAANRPAIGERRYFNNILTGITHPCSILGDGVNDADDLPFLEMINIESNVNINIGILEITGNKVMIHNTGVGSITITTGAGNITLLSGYTLILKYTGTIWVYYSTQVQNLNVTGIIYGKHENFETGWLLNEMGGAGVADWTNVHLGNDPTDPTDNLTHNLNAPLSDILIKVLISTDGTDANSFEFVDINLYRDNPGDNRNYGIGIFAVDNNNILIQTGGDGIRFMNADGTLFVIDVENWYYKIKIWKLG